MLENNILRTATSLIWHYNSCTVWRHLTAKHASNQTKFCNTMNFTFCDFYKTCWLYLHDFNLQFLLTYIQGVSRLMDITAGGDFLGLCDQKSSYKHVSDFGRLWSYGHFLIPIHALVWTASYGTSWRAMY